MWKVGVVGAGYWSDKHLQAWQRIPGVQIQGLCDLDSDKLRSKGEAYGIPGDMLYSEEDISEHEADSHECQRYGHVTHRLLCRLYLRFAKYGYAVTYSFDTGVGTGPHAVCTDDQYDHSEHAELAGCPLDF